METVVLIAVIFLSVFIAIKIDIGFSFLNTFGGGLMYLFAVSTVVLIFNDFTYRLGMLNQKDSIETWKDVMDFGCWHLFPFCLLINFFLYEQIYKNLLYSEQNGVLDDHPGFSIFLMYVTDTFVLSVTAGFILHPFISGGVIIFLYSIGYLISFLHIPADVRGWKKVKRLAVWPAVWYFSLSHFKKLPWQLSGNL